MYLGVAWYPEHWEEKQWTVDLDLMQQAGINVVRIGEYTWSRLEAREGQFEIDWLERAVNLAGERGIRVVMCTPIDAPPAWMSHRYPEILRVDENGKRQVHGARRHFSPASPLYRKFSSRIVEEMAKRFGTNQNIIGWQIGNEFCYISYDPHTHKLFQQWLKERYGTIEELNRAWTLSYWSEEYTDWSEIPLPEGWPNPCFDMAFFRFRSDIYREFVAEQAGIIRKFGPNQWITHNAHGWQELDFARILEPADVVSWDPYPGATPITYGRFGWVSDYCRNLKKRKHWIIETQPGRVNWTATNPEMARGSVRDLCWHFYAHGAEAVCFWQWRAALGGQEQYHGTIVGPSGRPRPLYAEVAQVGKEIARVAEALDGAKTESPVAALFTYQDQYAIKHQRQHRDFEPWEHLQAYCQPIREAGVNVDVIDPATDLAKYRLLMTPHLQLLTPELARKLADYVHAGGHLLLGARSGFKDSVNALLPELQPGNVLSELLGAHVEDFYTVEKTVELQGKVATGQAKIWAEYVQPVNAETEVLLRYGKLDGWVDNQPAMVTRQVGKGRISYLGTWPDEATFRQIAAWALQISGVELPGMEIPAGVELCRQRNGQREIWIVINHTEAGQTLKLPKAMQNLLADGPATDVLDLSARDVAVLCSDRD